MVFVSSICLSNKKYSWIKFIGPSRTSKCTFHIRTFGLFLPQQSFGRADPRIFLLTQRNISETRALMNDQTQDVPLWMNMYGRMTENIVGDWLRNTTISQTSRKDLKKFCSEFVILCCLEKKFHWGVYWNNRIRGLFNSKLFFWFILSQL